MKNLPFYSGILISIYTTAVLLTFVSPNVLYAVPPDSPYLPGETLDPGCSPGGTNCSVNHAPDGSAGNIQFQNYGYFGSATDLTYATTTGNFGIGTSSPYAKLSVTGEALANFFTATSTSATSTLPNLSTTNIDTAFTKSSVIFADAQGILSEDNTNFKYTDSTNSLFLGGDLDFAATKGIDNTAYVRFSDINNDLPGELTMTFSSENADQSVTWLGSQAGENANITLSLGGVGAQTYTFPDYNGIFALTGASMPVSFGTLTTSGNVGILDSSPTFNLDVTGNGRFTSLVDASHFTATSTTATSTFAGGLLVGTTTVGISSGRLALDGAFTINSSNGAIVIGDTSGDARGNGSIDVQSSRSASTQVSSGVGSSAFGINNISSGLNASAYGYNNTASNSTASAFGYLNSASASGASAFGLGNIASASGASAFGRSVTASASNAQAFGVGFTNSVADSVAIGYFTPALYTISGGNVGIGTSSPFTKLAVAGIVTANNFNATSTTATSTFAGDISVDGGKNLAIVASDGDYRYAYMDTSQVLNFSGGAGNTATLNAAGAWGDASDIAYKENIEDLAYGLNEVMQLNPRSYNFKHIPNEQYIGFIAQELEQVIPEVVYGEDGHKTVSYGQLTSVLTKAIQELSYKVELIAGKIVDGVVHFGEIAVERLAVKNLSVGDKDNLGASGITIIDRITGEPVCIYVADGETHITNGACESEENDESESQTNSAGNNSSSNTSASEDGPVSEENDPQVTGGTDNATTTAGSTDVVISEEQILQEDGVGNPTEEIPSGLVGEAVQEEPSQEETVEPEIDSPKEDEPDQADTESAPES